MAYIELYGQEVRDFLTPLNKHVSGLRDHTLSCTRGRNNLEWGQFFVILKNNADQENILAVSQ